MLKKHLGMQIRKLRKEHGYSQEKFAESTDYSVDFISLVERGINTPSIEGCQRIADALQISLSELFDFELPPMS